MMIQFFALPSNGFTFKQENLVIKGFNRKTKIKGIKKLGLKKKNRKICISLAIFHKSINLHTI